MNPLNKIAENIVAKSQQNYPGQPGDYYVDGFLHCGKCKGKKQSTIVVQGRVLHPHCLCACELEKLEAKETEQKRLALQKAREEHLQKLRSLSMMDERHKAQTFASWQRNDKEKTICQNYVATFVERLSKNQGLMFYGESGTGKTFAASCIANALLGKGYSVVMTSFTKFISNAQYTDDTLDLLRYMNSVDLLVLDDLGAERNSSFAIEKVFELIENRANQLKPVILTTNLSIEEMKNPVDLRYKRIYQRVFELCYPVPFAGKSFRLDTATNNFHELKEILERIEK